MRTRPAVALLALVAPAAWSAACSGDVRGSDAGDAARPADVSRTNDVTSVTDTSAPCAPGMSRPCYDGADGTQNVGVCRAGVQTCQGAGEFGSWSACAGQVTPRAETCGDALDQSCNGQIDEGCVVDGGVDAPAPTDAPMADAPMADAPPLPPDAAADVPTADAIPDGGPTTVPVGTVVDDYDVAGDGSLFVAGVSGTTLSGRCFAPDGSARGPAFTIATGVFEAANGVVQVNTSRRARTTLVTWIAMPSPGAFTMRTISSRLYDAACAPIGPSFAWPPGPYTHYVYDAAMDQDGNFVLFWQQAPGTAANLSFYDARGARLGADLMVDPALCWGNYGLHVAVNALTGAGVATCQHHVSDPIYYRRFSASRTWTDAAMVRVPESAGASSWYESHVVGVNDSGEFAIEWENYTARQFHANVYSTTGALVRSVILGPTGTAMGFDAFRQRHQTAAIYDGRDFVFRDDVTPTTFWRVNPAGAVVGCARSSFSRHTLRTGGTMVPHLLTGAGIARDAVDLTAVRCP